jgi:hypothetical protein
MQREVSSLYAVLRGLVWAALAALALVVICGQFPR